MLTIVLVVCVVLLLYDGMMDSVDALALREE